MDDRWLSVSEIAVYLGVSKDTIYTWLADKGLPGHKVGRFWKFKKDELDDWVRAGGAHGDAGARQRVKTGTTPKPKGRS